MRSIEHGNLIREPAAQAIKSADAFLVPTMVTYEAIYREGKRYGIGDHQIAEDRHRAAAELQGLTYAYKAGCKIGSGSDLLGDMASQRAVEFELKGQVMKPMEVLLSATKVNAELFRMTTDRQRGARQVRRPDRGEGNPLKNLRVFQNQDNSDHHEGRPALQADPLMRIVDLSFPIAALPLAVEPALRSSHARGDNFQSTVLTLACHAYTHVDAPVHFLPDDRDMADMPVDQWMGRRPWSTSPTSATTARSPPPIWRGAPATCRPATSSLLRTDWPRKVGVAPEVLETPPTPAAGPASG